jgi:phage gp46-like protein
MIDFGLQWDPEALSADFGIENNDLSTEEGLRTAVIWSLFTDRRAELGDVLPDGETDRRGWFGDVFPTVPGDKWGSRLWLLSREKITAETLARGETYALEALQWLVDDKVASRIAVSAERMTEPLGAAVGVEIERPTGDVVRFRFGRAWVAEQARN